MQPYSKDTARSVYDPHCTRACSVCSVQGLHCGVFLLQQVPHDVVAVKCVDRRRLSSTSVENLITEIEVMKQLKHKHIVRLLDFEVQSLHSSRTLYCIECVCTVE